MSEPAPAIGGGQQQIPRPPGVRPGAGAWWSRAGAAVPTGIGLHEVEAAFARATDDPDHPTLPRAELPSTDPRPAAVLCALFEEAGQAEVILTRRSELLRSHTGEIAFPGGRIELGESAQAAALREAQEEIGLDPAAVRIVGTLTPLATFTSRSAVAPFVGLLRSRPRLVANPAEVDRILTVPLGELVSPGVYHEELWPTGREGPERRDHAVHFFALVDETVWGATARLLRELLDRVLGPTRRCDARTGTLGLS